MASDAQSSARFIYKILPSAASDARHQFPVPIPADHVFFLSDLDAKVCSRHVLQLSLQERKALESSASDD